MCVYMHIILLQKVIVLREWKDKPPHMGRTFLQNTCLIKDWFLKIHQKLPDSWLAQSVEHTTHNLWVINSRPTLGVEIM